MKIQNIPGRVSSAKCELVFIASDIPPLGLSKYNVKETGMLAASSPAKKKITTDTWIKNDLVKILIDKTGKLSKIFTSPNSSKVHLKQEFAFYRGAVGNNSPPNYVVKTEKLVKLFYSMYNRRIGQVGPTFSDPRVRSRSRWATLSPPPW